MLLSTVTDFQKFHSIYTYLCVSSLSPLYLATSDFDVFQFTVLVHLVFKSDDEILLGIGLYRGIGAVSNEVPPVHSLTYRSGIVFLCDSEQ